MKNGNSSCSGDSDPLSHCKPDSCRPQVDPTQIIKSVFFRPVQGGQCNTQKALYSIWLENHLSQQLAGNKQKHDI